MPMRPRSSLRRRILLGLFGYAALLSIAVAIQGVVFNEHAEQLVWQTLLQSELDHFLERSRIDPQYRWTDTDTVSLYDASREPQRVPAVLRALPPGVHDDIAVNGSERVVMVRDVDGHRLILALDITELEAREFDMALTVAGSAITMIALLGLLIAWAVNRLLQPLSNMAVRIGELQPGDVGRPGAAQRIEVPESASAELLVIANALNDYLERNARFVERERAFIDSTSHELRTPIAVIVGATELGLEHTAEPEAVRNQLARIQRTARDVEQLISLLLVLAKDPARLASSSDRVALEQLLPEIVEDHRHLTRDKDLTLVLGAAAVVRDRRAVADRAGRDRQPAAQRDRAQRPRRGVDRAAARCHRGHPGSRPWHDAGRDQHDLRAHRARQRARGRRHRPGSDRAPVRAPGLDARHRLRRAARHHQHAAVAPARDAGLSFVPRIVLSAKAGIQCLVF